MTVSAASGLADLADLSARGDRDDYEILGLSIEILMLRYAIRLDHDDPAQEIDLLQIPDKAV